MDSNWREKALSSKEKGWLKARDIEAALHEQEITTEADIQIASSGTWDRILVDNKRIPGVIEDLLKAKATQGSITF